MAAESLGPSTVIRTTESTAVDIATAVTKLDLKATGLVATSGQDGFLKKMYISSKVQMAFGFCTNMKTQPIWFK